jgi:hypothetical protein
VRGTLLAAVSPDNTPHGANLTFVIPVVFFVVVATVLYLRFRGPHRVPGHVALASSRWAGAGPRASVHPDVARAVSSDKTVTTEKAATADTEQAAPEESSEDGA